MENREISVQSARKVALATLSIAAAGLAASVPNALATETQNVPQPAVFISQQAPAEITFGDKLQQYEAQLAQRLGMRKSGGCSSGTSSSEAASDCDD